MTTIVKFLLDKRYICYRAHSKLQIKLTTTTGGPILKLSELKCQNISNGPIFDIP